MDTATGHSHNASAKSSDGLKVVRSLATAEVRKLPVACRDKAFEVSGVEEGVVFNLANSFRKS